MRDKEIKFEEIEVSHTLGGTGKGGVQGRGKWRGCTYYSAVRYTTSKWSRRILNRDTVWDVSPSRKFDKIHGTTTTRDMTLFFRVITVMTLFFWKFLQNPNHVTVFRTRISHVTPAVVFLNSV